MVPELLCFITAKREPKLMKRVGESNEGKTEGTIINKTPGSRCWFSLFGDGFPDGRIPNPIFNINSNDDQAQ